MRQSLTITLCFKTFGPDRLDGLLVWQVFVVWFLFYQIPLLKYVLARWLLDAGFLALLQPVLRFIMPMGVIWHAWWLYFGVLEDPGTIPGRSWDDPGTLEGTRKDPGTSRLGFYRFFVDLGDPF